MILALIISGHQRLRLHAENPTSSSSKHIFHSLRIFSLLPSNVSFLSVCVCIQLPLNLEWAEKKTFQVPLKTLSPNLAKQPGYHNRCSLSLLHILCILLATRVSTVKDRFSLFKIMGYINFSCIWVFIRCKWMIDHFHGSLRIRK